MKRFVDLIAVCLPHIKEILPWDFAALQQQHPDMLLLDIRGTVPRAGRCIRFPGRSSAMSPTRASPKRSYYTWVVQFGILGLGRNVPIATGNMSDSLLALVDGKFVNLVVPYPIGFFTKWVEGRIDDAGSDWRGRALWTTFSTRTMFHLEGGTDNRPKVVRFQLRPDPLAR